MLNVPQELVCLIFLRLGGRGRRSYSRPSQVVHTVYATEDWKKFNPDMFLFPFTFFFWILAIAIFIASLYLAFLANFILISPVILIAYYALARNYLTSSINDFNNKIFPMLVKTINKDYSYVEKMLSKKDKYFVTQYVKKNIFMSRYQDDEYEKNDNYNNRVIDHSMIYFRNKKYVEAASSFIGMGYINEIKSYCGSIQNNENKSVIELDYYLLNGMFPIIERLAEAKINARKSCLKWMAIIYTFIILVLILPKKG